MQPFTSFPKTLNIDCKERTHFSTFRAKALQVSLVSVKSLYTHCAPEVQTHKVGKRKGKECNCTRCTRRAWFHHPRDPSRVFQN